MKKINYLWLAAGLTALASCSSDDFLGGKTASSEKSSNVIGFGMNAPSFTRDLFEHGSAAEKLNNNFIVYGFKTTYASATPALTSDIAAGTGDVKVFDHYNVNYVEGTANTTESNTSGWEYVGLLPHESSSSQLTAQSIKYWDYNTDQYVFSAISGVDITAVKATTAVNGSGMAFNAGVMTVNGTATEYDKGWEVTIPQGGSLSDLYASERVVAKKDDGASGSDYKKTVSLKFYNMGARVRFAMYETVPGYSIQIKKFYHDISGTPAANTTNFDIDGHFTTLGNTATGTKLLVTYYPDGALVNRPKVTPSTGAVESNNGVFGTNIQPTEAIGTASNNATYDQSDKSYTDILPGNGGELKLKVDYTLTSTDGSGETINVYGATATVPENFTEWKANFAYTYVFKISDNTNGTTGEGNMDPTTNPTGLYPITFDAVVIGNEDGIQETITSVSNPSITTYQKGEVVTANNEYVAGEDIYFEDNARDISNYHVYEVNNLTTNLFETQSNMTEEVVANYLRNFCVLTEVTVTPSTGAQPTNFIPLSDGTYIKKTANQAGMFTPAAGKTYVIANDAANDATQWKVVKVQGTATAVTYTQAITTTYTSPATMPQITATDGTITYKLTSNSPADANVLGATPCIKIYKSGNDVTSDFDIADNTNGTYTITLTNDAIAAGANGTYTIKFNNVDCPTQFEVALTYALSPASITVIAGNATGANTVLNVNSTATDGKVVNTDNKIKVENTATGTYKVTASADAAAGGHTLTIGGQPLTVTVNTYSFSENALTITRKASGDATGNITINENGAAKTGLSLATSPTLASGTSMTGETAGVYTYTVTPASVGGTYDISYENAKAQVIVNAYTLTAANANIAKNTGSTVLTLKKDNGTVTTENAKTANVVVNKNGTPAAAGTYKLTTNGKTLTFNNVSESGVYTFEYKVGSDVVAITTVVVGTETLDASASPIAVDGTSTLTYKIDGTATDGGDASVDNGASGTDWIITNGGDGTYTFTGKVAGTYEVTIGTKTVTITVTAS